MSISSIASSTRAPPVPPQSSLDTNRTHPAVTQSSGGTSTPAATSVDPFQQLSSDIQALLIQSQGQTGTANAARATASTSATSSPNGTTTATLVQKLASDLQSLFSQIQGTQTTGAQGAGHHHHHHAEFDASSTTDPSDPATESATTPSRAFAADIAQAYGGTASASSGPAVTA